MSYKNLSYFVAAKHLHVEAGKISPHRAPADGAFCDYQLQLAAINYVAELARAVGTDILIANGDGEQIALAVSKLRPEQGRVDGRAPATTSIDYDAVQCPHRRTQHAAGPCEPCIERHLAKAGGK